jgi:hypothetical protein
VGFKDQSTAEVVVGSTLGLCYLPEGLYLPLFNDINAPMDRVARLLNEMVVAGVITDYAVFGAVAQMRYTEAVATLDADILVTVHDPEAIDILRPIYDYCREHGYHPEGEAIQVGEWPVQFIPTFSALTEEALQKADTADLDGTPIRVVRADYLAVIALSVGRAKDIARILSLCEAGSVTLAEISYLADKHGLTAKLVRFKERFSEE